MPEEPWAGLAEAVSAVRAELQQAMDEGERSALKFRSGPVEMEFAVEVKKFGEARAKVLVLPWSAEAKAGLNSGRTHRVKITLQPVDDTGADAQIGADVARRPGSRD
ncbi:trypco2 family protein [Streptomyces sp. NPDC001982]|uniref:trypco2 family protein n=1 Tax=Streptomyces sp. NPDC001982 TaxID=3154405 RepID=UPI003327A788